MARSRPPDREHPSTETQQAGGGREPATDLPVGASLAPEERNGPFVTIDDERYYVVADVDRMPPFLMSIVSDGDRWMFLSSSGGLTAGRRSVEQALFPYETDDRLHRLGGQNGAVTTVRFLDGEADQVWRPLVGQSGRRQHRTLYKSVVGDAAVFEERDDAGGLTFRYRWASNDRFGFVRTAMLTNESDTSRTIEVIDGVRNILPYGLVPSLYLARGNLTNAYKRSELIDPELRLAVYSLESLVTDRPEPAEALRATITWSVGLDGASVSLHPDVTSGFGPGDLEGSLVTGMPGAYFLKAAIDLEPGESRQWSIAADVGLDQPAVTALRRELHSLQDPAADLATATRRASRALLEIVARADALQSTNDEVAVAHHLSDVTYNVMRGGIPMDGYLVDLHAFTTYLERRNRAVAERHRALLSTMGSTVNRRDLLGVIERAGDVDLARLGHEYLPFSFSRRHGDPSRPWNAFSIRTVDDEGNRVRYFEGNWRDIFQNWEAMCTSFPEYLPDIVSVFVDASTPDGYNPYRITSDGIDWEVPDPDDPWSNIGYWGDHQIIYLLRLLEGSDRYLPGAIRNLLGEARFSYADVPYRIAPYERLFEDPKATIDFDEDAALVSAERVESVGFDGKLVWRDGGVYHVTLAEKLVVPALAKLSNYVPGGGIWMNTQRPEWNDANNALVGHGLSMVTLYQLRAYLRYLEQLVDGPVAAVEMSREVADWLEAVTLTLSSPEIEPGDDRERKRLMDALGSSFSEYRSRIYENGFSGTTPVPLTAISSLCAAAIPHLDSTIRGAQRSDGLFDSYNLIAFSGDGAAIEHLGEMLEGQVAVIESGILDSDGCADVVEAMFESALYRPDQHSFLLYPARTLPSFLERNVVPRSAVEENPLLAEALATGGGPLLVEDADGRVRFHAEITSRAELEARLELLAADDRYRGLVSEHGATTVRTYADVFGHHSYTGRSGSMYGYEGLGSIYWHMVAKLLVALQESAFTTAASGASPGSVRRVVEAYLRVRSGMGFNKTPSEHGAIPIDPYSHTPAHAGAQQPGMTGLVKEEILVRAAELGVVVDRGEMRFDTTFLLDAELLRNPRTWSTLDPALQWKETDVPSDALGLTVCQVPVIVSRSAGEAHIEVELADGTVRDVPGRSLGRELSAEVFGRTGEITQIRAHLDREL